MPFETLYNNLFPAQRQEADQLFSRALQCSKNFQSDTTRVPC